MPIIRRSKKRDAMLQLIQGTDCHPTADWVFHTLKEQYPDLSLGTVYRNLNQLCEEGLVFRLGAIDGQERFDARLDPHSHFVCSRCSRVLDLPDLTPGQSEVQRLSRQYGFTLEGCEFKLRGLCNDCREKMKIIGGN